MGGKTKQEWLDSVPPMYHAALKEMLHDDGTHSPNAALEAVLEYRGYGMSAYRFRSIAKAFTPEVARVSTEPQAAPSALFSPAQEERIREIVAKFHQNVNIQVVNSILLREEVEEFVKKHHIELFGGDGSPWFTQSSVQDDKGKSNEELKAERIKKVKADIEEISERCRKYHQERCPKDETNSY